MRLVYRLGGNGFESQLSRERDRLSFQEAAGRCRLILRSRGCARPLPRGDCAVSTARGRQLAAPTATGRSSGMLYRNAHPVAAS